MALVGSADRVRAFEPSTSGGSGTTLTQDRRKISYHSPGGRYRTSTPRGKPALQLTPTARELTFSRRELCRKALPFVGVMPLCGGAEQIISAIGQADV